MLLLSLLFNIDFVVNKLRLIYFGYMSVQNLIRPCGHFAM